MDRRCECPASLKEGHQQNSVKALASKVTKTGPDGLPYAAWAADSDTSSDILFDCNLSMFNDDIINLNYNVQYQLFIPKSSCDEATPKALNTRPLGLKNADPKILARVNISQFSKVLFNNCTGIQKGFVGGRNFNLNIPSLDMFSRMQAMNNHFGGEAIIALWDFANAFPSIFHDWILKVLAHLGFPIGFISFIDCLLFHNVAIWGAKIRGPLCTASWWALSRVVLRVASFLLQPPTLSFF